MNKESIMSKLPKVTIITVTRNRAKLLKRAIDSVLSQTFKDFEYIIIDGASTDDTSKVVKNFNDERIIYVQQTENKATIISFDFAVNLSRSEYLTFLDDDDEYLPTKIEKQYNLMKSLPPEYGCVYCWMDYYDDRSNKLVKEHHPSNRGYIFYDCIEKQSMGGLPTLFMKRDVYLTLNGWNSKLKYVADWEFNTRIARKYLIDFVPEVLVRAHIDHPFERMSSSQSNLESLSKIQNLIDYHNHYLTEFGDGFKKFPIKKTSHLMSLAKLYARLGLVKQSIFKIKELTELRIKKYLMIKLVVTCGILVFQSTYKNYES